MKICIPSINRPDKVSAKKLLPNSLIIVPDSQLEEYKKYNSDVISIPDSRDGSVSKKRNAVLDLIDDDILMVDDDLKRVERIGGESLNGSNLMRFIENGFVMAKELGVGIWGLNITNDRMKVAEYQPFSLTKQIYCFVGILKDHIRYDERLVSSEDVDFWLQKLFRYRKVLRFNLYYPVSKRSNVGGLKKEDRVEDRILEDWKMLQRKWGEGIIRIKDNGKFGLSSPMRGV